MVAMVPVVVPVVRSGSLAPAGAPADTVLPAAEPSSPA